MAGACLYTRYNFLIRMIMKQISRQAGGSTDTTRDHDTNSIERSPSTAPDAGWELALIGDVLSQLSDPLAVAT